MSFNSGNHKPKPKKNQNTQALGNLGEKVALDFLIKKGLKCLEKQYRCRLGEWDLIMKQGSVIVFVEVRYRKNDQFCLPYETINHSKQQKLIRTAEYYLLKYPTSDCRMDVVSISGKQPNFDITWIPDAFGVQ